jgi:hypothetical protein
MATRAKRSRRNGRIASGAGRSNSSNDVSLLTPPTGRNWRKWITTAAAVGLSGAAYSYFRRKSGLGSDKNFSASH